MANSTSWMTNFHYGQELRSLYMNGTLNSGFKPGIYNSGMALYVIDEAHETPTQTAGIYLFIKKGTTLIFSNKYNYVNQRYERDITNAGSYIIKCVAYNDIQEPLITLGKSVATGTLGYILGSDIRKAAKKFYITASMLYDGNEDQQSDAPTFHLVLDNPDFKKRLNTGGESDADDSNFFFINADAYDFRVPDGSHSYGEAANNKLSKFSYLVLGSVIATSNVDKYVEGDSWRTEGMNYADEWVSSHVFMGRGLPDYRQSLTDDSNNLAPEILLDTTLDKFYLDASGLFEQNIIYSTETDWRKNYRWGYEESSQSSLYDIDHSYLNRRRSYLLDHKVHEDMGESLDYDEEVSDIIEELNAKKLSFKIPELQGVEFVLVYDIIFLALRQKQSNTKEDSINKLFNEFDDTNISEMKIVPFRGYSTCSFKTLNPAKDLEDDITSLSNELYSPSLNHKKIIPLDVCEININRLRKLVENRDILPAIVDYMKQHESESPYLNPQEASSLVPAAIAFRKFEITDRDPETGNILKMTPVDSISKATSTEVTSGKKLAGRVHPANVLSFFDLQYKTNKLNGITLTTPDVFGILPVIN